MQEGVVLSLDLLRYRERAPRSEAEGALILIHGRGADENDLFPLLDMFDPDGRLAGVCPRGPLSMPPGGAHWYAVHRVGFPDPSTFFPAFDTLSRWVDAYVASKGLAPGRVVIGGFSQGAVMSFALSLGEGRTRPAGTIALSGFVPIVDGFDIAMKDLSGYPVAIGHGTYDDVIRADFSRDARDRLETAGATVMYRESPLPHTIDPEYIPEIAAWLTDTLD